MKRQCFRSESLFLIFGVRSQLFPSDDSIGRADAEKVAEGFSYQRLVDLYILPELGDFAATAGERSHVYALHEAVRHKP